MCIVNCKVLEYKSYQYTVTKGLNLVSFKYNLNKGHPLKLELQLGLVCYVISPPEEQLTCKYQSTPTGTSSWKGNIYLLLNHNQVDTNDKYD